MSEKSIQKAIIEYLIYLKNQGKLFFFRSGAGAIRTETGGYFKTGAPGVPDICVIANGKYIGLEIKTAKGHLTPIQELVHHEIELAGGLCVVVRSVDDVRSLFKDMDII